MPDVPQATADEATKMDSDHEGPEIAPQRLDRLMNFKLLQLPPLVTDLLNRQPDDVKFQEVMDDALMRASAEHPSILVAFCWAPLPCKISFLRPPLPTPGRNMWVALHVRPKSTDDWKAALEALPEGPKLFRYDPKTGVVNGGQTAVCPIYRFKPLAGNEFKKVMGAVFGDLDKASSNRATGLNSNKTVMPRNCRDRKP